MIGKMHALLARMTTKVFVEYSIVAAAVIKVDIVARFQSNANRSGESFDSCRGI